MGTTAAAEGTRAAVAGEATKADEAAAADAAIKVVVAVVAAAATPTRGTTKGTKITITRATITRVIIMITASITIKAGAKTLGLQRAHHLVKQGVRRPDRDKDKWPRGTTLIILVGPPPADVVHAPWERTVAAREVARHGVAGETPSPRAPLNLS